MARTHTDRILFGAAYYDEYMPKNLDRVDEDMRMMKEAGINLIRIAESTWSTEEPQPGVFDFTHIDRALDAAQRAGIDVIVGTPTYAVPTWMVKMHPEVLAVTPAGPGKYGARQIMDIVKGYDIAVLFLDSVVEYTAYQGQYQGVYVSVVPVLDYFYYGPDNCFPVVFIDRQDTGSGDDYYFPCLVIGKLGQTVTVEFEIIKI